MCMQYKTTEMILGIWENRTKFLTKKRIGQVQSTSVRAQSMKMYGNPWKFRIFPIFYIFFSQLFKKKIFFAQIFFILKI